MKTLIKLQHFGLAEVAIALGRLLFGRQFAQQRIVVDGAQQTMRVKIGLIAKSHGGQGDEFGVFFGLNGRMVVGLHLLLNAETAELVDLDVDEFVFTQIGLNGRMVVVVGIEHDAVLHFGRAEIERCFVVEVMGEEVIDFADALVVFGDGEEAALGIVSKIDPDDRFDAAFLGHPDEVELRRRVIDISEQGVVVAALCVVVEQLFRSENTVSKRVVGVHCGAKLCKVTISGGR